MSILDDIADRAVWLAIVSRMLNECQILETRINIALLSYPTAQQARILRDADQQLGEVEKKMTPCHLFPRILLRKQARISARPSRKQDQGVVMSYQNITRPAVEAAEPLDMDRPARFSPLERQANITIEAGPLGLTVRCEYTGSLASIPAAIERLRSAGVLELVSGGATKPAGGNNVTPARKAAQRTQPAYDGSGQPMCPIHRKPLSEGRYGAFCPSKAKPGEEQNDKGYCSLKFD